MSEFHYPIRSREAESRAIGAGAVDEYLLTPEELKHFNSNLPEPDRIQSKASKPFSLQRKTSSPPSLQQPEPASGVKRRSKYEHVTKDIVLKEFKKGMTITQIEEKYGMSKNFLYGRLRSWGIRSPKSPQFSKAENNKATPAISDDRRPLDIRIDNITVEVVMELRRAMGKFSPLASAHEGYAVLKEEVDEAWEAIKANDLIKARMEMTQVAAMAIRFLHDLPQQNNPSEEENENEQRN
ncbi:hypothetical protein V3851_23805 [Paenibacillus sp. M1]|uniref:Clr5 domain-containing protein n=1 Tax=Paenibacillus haidiansis TaxID=1574488 RepID=A0ABU7VXX9_9BACL